MLLSGVIDLLILVLIQESLVAYSSHLLLANYALQSIERLLGHSDIKTNMIYLQTVPSVTLKEAKSPLIACRAALAPRLFRWIGRSSRHKKSKDRKEKNLGAGCALPSK